LRGVEARDAREVPGGARRETKGTRGRKGRKAATFFSSIMTTMSSTLFLHDTFPSQFALEESCRRFFSLLSLITRGPFFVSLPFISGQKVSASLATEEVEVICKAGSARKRHSAERAALGVAKIQISPNSSVAKAGSPFQCASNSSSSRRLQVFPARRRSSCDARLGVGCFGAQ